MAGESFVADEAVASDEVADEWPVACWLPPDADVPKATNIINVPMNTAGVSRLVRARLCSESVASCWGINPRVFPMSKGLRLLSFCAYLNIQGCA